MKVELTGMGIRRARVANLPPEVKEPVLRAAMSKYGDEKDNGLSNIDTSY